MSVLAKARYFGRTAGQGLWHAPFIHFVAVITLAISLFTLGLARTAAVLVEDLIQGLGGEVQLTVYLKPGLGEADAEGLAKTLTTSGGAKVRIVTPDMALERLVKELGDPGKVLTDVRENPLPTTLEVALPPQSRKPETLKALAAALRSEPQVADVDYGEEAVARLSAIARALRLAGLGILIIVVIATVVIVSATLQLAIYARREEVEIQKLVGATNRFVKAPFLLEGVFQGLLGALVALGALWAFFTFAGPKLSALFAFLKVGAARMPLDLALAGQVLGVGVLLGLFGSFVAVGRFLRV